MGRKQRQFDRIFALLEQQINQQRQPSPWETAMSNEYNTINSFLQSGDYRNLPKGITIDLMSQSDNNRMREMMMGRDTSGQAAKGAMGQIANSQKMLLNDQAARDWSGAYEQKIGDLHNRKLGLGQALQGMYSDRMGAGTAGLSSMLQLSQQRPSGGFWKDLFGGLLQSGATAAMSFI